LLSFLELISSSGVVKGWLRKSVVFSVCILTVLCSIKSGIIYHGSMACSELFVQIVTPVKVQGIKQKHIVACIRFIYI
jgi:hypothetical protein